MSPSREPLPASSSLCAHVHPPFAQPAHRTIEPRECSGPATGQSRVRLSWDHGFVFHNAQSWPRVAPQSFFEPTRDFLLFFGAIATAAKDKRFFSELH